MAEQGDYVCYVLVTASQAALLSAACQETLVKAYADDGEDPRGLCDALAQLRDFFADVAENPTNYANGEILKTLKRIRRAQKGRP